MEKIDLKKHYKVAFSSKKQPQIVTIPAMQYVTFRGKGDPNRSIEFENAMGVLYGMAYTLKFSLKEEGKDFVVAPLEGQWWAEDMKDFTEDNKDNWFWKVMIALPDYITEKEFKEAKAKLQIKKNPPMLERAELETLEDGLSVQVLYLGPYAQEAATISAMHHFAEEQGYRLRGKHREVYMSNPQRTAPEKLRTIIRHPLEKVE
ncbi:MAG: GyrI-like domain-containing protein [Spirochaetaceae bacterium]|nr:GyrI-like domain-containing protein [Spirochaetaceae bacterium]